MPKINGQKGAFGQPAIIGVNESGPYAVFTWEGTRREIESIIPAIRGAKGTYELQYSFSGAKDKIVARFPLQVAQPGVVEEPVNDWEFFAQEIEKDVLDADLPIINALTADEKRVIRANVDNPQEGKSPAIVNNGQPDANGFTIYYEMLAGLRSVRVLVPTLRHTTTVSQIYGISGSLVNVGRILTTSTLIQQENISSAIVLPSDIDPAATTERPARHYGWYKKFPTIRIALHQKIQVVQEWEYGLWSHAIYGASI